MFPFPKHQQSCTQSVKWSWDFLIKNDWFPKKLRPEVFGNEGYDFSAKRFLLKSGFAEWINEELSAPLKDLLFY